MDTLIPNRKTSFSPHHFSWVRNKVQFSLLIIHGKEKDLKEINMYCVAFHTKSICVTFFSRFEPRHQLASCNRGSTINLCACHNGLPHKIWCDLFEQNAPYTCNLCCYPTSREKSPFIICTKGEAHLRILVWQIPKSFLFKKYILKITYLFYF